MTLSLINKLQGQKYQQPFNLSYLKNSSKSRKKGEIKFCQHCVTAKHFVIINLFCCGRKARRKNVFVKYYCQNQPLFSVKEALPFPYCNFALKNMCFLFCFVLFCFVLFLFVCSFVFLFNLLLAVFLWN